MIADSYCPYCRKVRPFSIIKNVKPALVPQLDDYRETMFTASTAPGYIVVGRCPSHHRNAIGAIVGKDIVIPREQRQSVSYTDQKGQCPSRKAKV